MERINASARMVVPLSVRIYGFGSGGSVVGSVLFSCGFFLSSPAAPFPSSHFFLWNVGEQICRTMFG